MNITEIYRTLFLVVGCMGIFFLMSDLIEYIKSVYYKKQMYYNLEKIWNLATEDGVYSEKKVRKVLREECKSMHYKYALSNKYLKKIFCSPDDLLKAFLTTINGNSYDTKKFEILYEESKNEIKPYEIYVDKPAIRKFEILSVATTIIGIIVTLFSLF